ncbi:SIMPL domain-containing protein [Komagataeibacter sp. FNDCR2]|uniref:SIMPL domain-containing protein n=1 Tax=Komagataeibacter sp. FNDCR2 TaxID=2878682 RepID=UPI001E5D43D5|nr:SIMPL domain-containing protein [Komagataeibacter sp. FNDCR2]MCE2575335.1 SIMPL domain-containing protein [Komagataeibacter sp. FNDCR2]
MMTRYFRPSARRALPALVLAAALCPAAVMAQTPAADNATPDETTLDLIASGTVQARPDELTASFFAESRADTAAAAQAQVNALIAKAMATTAHVDGLNVNAESYFVRHDDGDPRQNRKPGWVARQTIRLTAQDGKILLPLIGQLQAENLALTQLDWSLSRARRAELTRQAESLALQDMQQRAQAAATTLKRKVSVIMSVVLEDQNTPHPMPMMMMARASADSMAPSAPAGMEDVTATAHGTLLLKP